MSDSGPRTVPKTASAIVHLTTAGAVSLAMQGASSILLARILLPSGYGLYSMALVVVSLMLPIRNLGIPAAVQYYSAQPRGGSRLRRIGLVGAILELTVGTGLAIVLIGFSYPIVNLLTQPDIQPVLLAALPILWFSGVYTVAYSLCLGSMQSKRAAALTILYSSSKALFSVVMVLWGYGPSGAMLGYGLGCVLSGLLSFVVIAKSETNEYAKLYSSATSCRELGRGLLTYGAPVGLSEMMVTLTTQSSMTIGMFFIASSSFGIYSVANTLFLYLSGVLYPIVLVLLSTFARVGGNSQNLEDGYRTSTLFSGILGGFASLFCAVFAVPIVHLLFGPAYADAAILFTLLCILNILLMPVGGLTNGSLLLARKYNREYFMTYLAAAIMTFPVALLVVPVWGYYGMIAVTFLSYGIPVMGCGYFIKKKIGIATLTRKGLKMQVSLLVSLGFGALLLSIITPFSGPLWFGIVGMIVLIMAFVLLILTGALTTMDAEYISNQLKGIPIIERMTHMLAYAVRTVSRGSDTVQIVEE